MSEGIRMRTALKIFAVAVIGTLLGLMTTLFVLLRGTMGGDVADGPWRTNLETGSAASGPYLRASVAVHGLLALNRSETIYYTAARDGSGAPLDGACTYKVEGRDPPTRWWSITAYGADDFLIPNPAGLYSASKPSVTRAADGTFTVTVARARADGDWIPVAPGRFSLTLRLYNPDPAVAADPAHVALPTIVKERCA
jgi:hypothetical protein